MAKISRKEIFSIPNLMGYFRILMIPVFSWMYLTASTREDVYRAAAVVFISSVTDLLDGWVARRFHMVTELGKFVDPLADKLTHGALALCLAFKYPLMWALAALLAVKEGYMAVMGLILLKRGKKLDGAMWFGKVCTALLFVGMLVLFLWYGMPEAAANGLILFMMAVMAAALLMYVPVFQENEKRSIKTERKTAESAICRGSAIFHPIRELRFPGFPKRFSVCLGLILVQDLLLLYKGIRN